MIRAAAITLCVATIFVLSLCLGATNIGPTTLAHLILNPDTQDFVVWNHRLPRTIIAFFIGGGIGLAGALVQGVIRNPLASPDILGVTQGAGLMLSIGLLMIPGLAVSWLPVLAIAGGALGAMALMAYNVGTFSSLRFALSGVAISACFAGVTEFLLLTHPVEINTALLSLTGSLWARGWEHVPYAVMLVPFMLAAIPLAKALDLIALGDQTAQALGTNVGRAQRLALSLAVILTGISVAIAGPVGFVGLVAPHIARRITPARMMAILPASAAVGACVVMAADLVGRAIAPPTEVPVGVMTAVIGAPYFLWLLFRMR